MVARASQAHSTQVRNHHLDFGLYLGSCHSVSSTYLHATSKIFNSGANIQSIQEG